MDDLVERVNDLVELNGALDEKARTKAWLESAQAIVRALPRVPPAVREFLVDAELWRELGHMLRDPAGECRELLRRLPAVEPAPFASLFVPDVRALVAANRLDEAQELTALLLSLDPSPVLAGELAATGARLHPLT
jgi:hypothetical protein